MITTIKKYRNYKKRPVKIAKDKGVCSVFYNKYLLITKAFSLEDLRGFTVASD